MEQKYLHFRRKKRRQLKRMKRRRMAAAAVAALLIYFIFLGLLPTFGIISPGTNYCGKSLGFLTVKGAEKKINKYKEDFLSADVVLTHKEKSATMTSQQLGLSMNEKQVAKDALKESKKRHFFSRMAQALKKEPVHTPLVVDEATLNRSLASLNGVLYDMAKPATVATEGEKVVIRPGNQGEVPDTARATIDLSHGIDGPIEIRTKTVAPDIEAQALAGIDGKLAEAVTTYDPADKSRTINVENGARYFRRIVLAPGEKLSFLATIGGITEAHGFVKGKTVSNGVETEGIGGGVCQVSTTMYNAVARSGLDVITKFNHSKAVPYAKEGLDCAVSDGYKDFIFANPFTKPVYIETKAKDGTLLCTIYGPAKEKPYTIDLVPEKVRDLPAANDISYTSDLAPGEVKMIRKQVNGSIYNTYAVYSMGGKELRRVFVARSRYVPVDGKVLVGKKK